jgi:lipid A 4'-phosphatase
MGSANATLARDAERAWRSDTIERADASTRAASAVWIWRGLGLLSPLLAIIALTVYVVVADADRAIARHFAGTFNDPWPMAEVKGLRRLTDIACYPGLALGIGGIIVALASRHVKRLRSIRYEGLFLGMVLIMGPGVIINGTMKPLFQRPRPCQTAEFRGMHAYVSPWQLAGPGNESCRSFPCGHASVGFVLAAPAFLLLRRRQRLWAVTFIGLGLLAGGFIGWCRIMQGGHYFSDVLWSAAVVYLAGLLMYPIYCWCLAAESRALDAPLANR